MKAQHAAIIMLLFVFGCTSPTTAVREAPIAYFGFTAVDCLWDDPHDMFSKTNYVDEVAGFTNLAQLCVFGAEELIGKRLGTFNHFGLKALLSVEPLLFERHADSSSPSGERLTLSSQAELHWRQFVDANAAWLTPAAVAAIDLAEEPVWNGVSEDDLLQAISIVKASLPTLPILVVEASPALQDALVPESLDWVGFRSYGHLNPSTDPRWLADLETLTAKLNPQQKLVIVAETQWLPGYEALGIGTADMARVAEHYLEVARATPETVALIGYSWAGGLDDPAQLGARDLPETVLETLRSIGQRILAP